MKKLLLTLSLATVCFAINAQNTFPSSGSVGVGTTSPVSPLEIRLDVSPNNAATLQTWNWIEDITSWGLRLDEYHTGSAIDQRFIQKISSVDNNVLTFHLGNVGIGTTSPVGRLHILGTTQSTDFSTTAFNIEQPYTDFGSQTLVGPSTMYRTNNGSSSWALGGIAGVVGTQGNTGGFPGGLAFYTKAADGNPSGIPAEQMRIAPNGSLLIGKSSQTNIAYKLDVNGNVRANAITVNTTGADYVFESSYKLLSLPTLKVYIDKNHHLPEIASAKEMQADGLNLGENQVKLLKKIEELTLYLIEKDRENKTQAEQLKSLHSQVTRLSEQIKSLTKTTNL